MNEPRLIEISKKIDRINHLQNTLMRLDDHFSKLKRQLFQIMQELKNEAGEP